LAKFNIEMLTPEEMEQMKEATFQILERTGVDIRCAEACDLLKNAGAKINGTIAKIPRELVEESIAQAPSGINIYDRNGNLAMDLSGHNSYFGPGVTCPYFYDPYTHERRLAVKQDVCNVAKVADALKNIDFLMSLCLVSDKTKVLADVHEVDAMMQNSTKPILTWSFTAENLSVIIDMAEAVVGGAQALREKPYLMVYAEPITPLVHTKESLEKIILLARRGVPSVYSPGMSFGGTAPVTLSGALSVALADVLTGVVISQLANPGAPIICGSNGGALDMRSMQCTYGSPEMAIVDAAGTQMYHYWNLPSFGLAGATDGKVIDAQAAWEVTAQIIFAMGAGANLVHDLGMMDVGMTGSLAFMVLCDEIVGFAKQLRRGMIVDEENLAGDVIAKVGPGGNFLMEEHTFRNFRKAMFIPELGLRKSWANWEADGKKTIADLTHEKVIRLLENHKPEPLDQEVLQKVQAIVEKAEQSQAKNVE